MLVDAIRSNQLPQVQPTASVRPDNAPTRTSGNSRSPVPVVTPVAPQPDTSNRVQVEWSANDGVVVQISDKKSGALIRQIPSEQVLSVARFIDQLLQQERNAGSSAAQTNSERNRRRSR